MPDHRGFSAWITCDGERLREYEVQVNSKDADVIECWVPSTTGSRFSVAWQNRNERPTATSGHVFVDGVDVASGIARPGRSVPVVRDGARTSSSYVRPFVFSELKLTDDESIAPRVDPSAQAIGTIRLEITRVVLGAAVPLQPTHVEERGPVHEKAKKAGAHVTEYGERRRSAKGRTTAVSNAPHDVHRTTPWVTFVFRYRSSAFLMAQDIIPNPARVAKRRASQDIVDVDADEESANKKIKLEAQAAFALENAEEGEGDGEDEDPSQAVIPSPSQSERTEDDGNGPRSSPPADDAEAPRPSTTVEFHFSPEPDLEIPDATMFEASQTQDSESDDAHSQSAVPSQNTQTMDSETMNIDGETLVG